MNRIHRPLETFTPYTTHTNRMPSLKMHFSIRTRFITRLSTNTFKNNSPSIRSITTKTSLSMHTTLSKHRSRLNPILRITLTIMTIIRISTHRPITRNRSRTISHNKSPHLLRYKPYHIIHTKYKLTINNSKPFHNTITTNSTLPTRPSTNILRLNQRQDHTHTTHPTTTQHVGVTTPSTTSKLFQRLPTTPTFTWYRIPVVFGGHSGGGKATLFRHFSLVITALGGANTRANKTLAHPAKTHQGQPRASRKRTGKKGATRAPNHQGQKHTPCM